MTNGERYLENGELPDHGEGCDCLLCQYKPFIKKREQKIVEAFEDQVLDTMGEFGDQPEQCLSIIGDLIGQRQHFRRYPNAPRTEEPA